MSVLDPTLNLTLTIKVYIKDLPIILLNVVRAM